MLKLRTLLFKEANGTFVTLNIFSTKTLGQYKWNKGTWVSIKREVEALKALDNFARRTLNFRIFIVGTSDTLSVY